MGRGCICVCTEDKLCLLASSSVCESSVLAGMGPRSKNSSLSSTSLHTCPAWSSGGEEGTDGAGGGNTTMRDCNDRASVMAYFPAE